MIKRDRAYLILEDGSVYKGYAIGAKGSTIGEVVFATGMVGYQEGLTDPSFAGQIVTQTFPLVGNYGTNDEDYESKTAYLNGYIVREICDKPSNFRCEKSLEDFLIDKGVVGICGLDTRALTRKIREVGVLNGMITTEYSEDKKADIVNELKSFKIKGVVALTSVKEKEFYKSENSKYHVALIDYGYKFNIRRCLLQAGCDVTVVPYNTTAEEIKALNPDGIMLSNGAGDPAENTVPIANLKEIFKLGIPVFGICLGHQLAALANGASTEKLKYGHRGANQPVLDIERDRVYITSQNHGYAVISESVDPAKGVVSHINVNDKSCEGVRYTFAPIVTVQFHPEACGGPKDTAYLFEEFVEMIKKYKGVK